MKIDEFLQLTAEAIEFEGILHPRDKVEDIDVWDSLGVLTLVELLDQRGIEVSVDDFEQILTIEDYLKLAGF